jgi:chemotaxis protein methyltransferase CheR
VSIDLLSPELSIAEFGKIRNVLYDTCGISLSDAKIGLVKSRLIKRMRELEMKSFEQYTNYLEKDGSGKELAKMIDYLTTNKTNFFRELPHFDFLKSRVLPETLNLSNRLRIWSAGCSSGEEPYSIAIIIAEESNLLNKDVKILATDISSRVLEKARAGVYESELISGIPGIILHKYFDTLTHDSGMQYRVKNSIKNAIRFARLNLVEPWPIRGPFDVIFCRNVMIYFDKGTRERLINRFYQLIRPGGYLFVGHSESLSSMEHKFQYLQPAVYMR